MSKSLPAQFSVEEVKAIALENGVHLALEMNLTDVIVESDSLSVVQSVQKKEIYGALVQSVQISFLHPYMHKTRFIQVFIPKTFSISLQRFVTYTTYCSLKVNLNFIILSNSSLSLFSLLPLLTLSLLSVSFSLSVVSVVLNFDFNG